MIIDTDIEQTLKPNLSKDEKLIWTGKPKSGIVFRASDTFLIPFSILWFGFAIFWETTVVSSGAPFFFMLWGIPFLVVGLYVSVGRFFIDARRRNNTGYGITNSRIIIRSGIFNIEVKSLNIRTLSDITLTEKANGTGTITFGPTDFRSSMMDGMEWPGVKKSPRFEFVPEVRQVYDLLIKQQQSNI